ncbi:alpha/beta-hydrolase [Lophium mytilinum]|uniref:Carboxylic ester hydrolase n=1 Tax=Lophium mytilinum TaxID=390894 RepID=A0A6A6QEF1_9PEZI|nr:alpha/beta-hydrolase [Lophium mytilinum]
MISRVLLSSFVLALSQTATALPGPSCPPDKPMVKAGSTEIYGTINSSFPHVEQYCSIPFALPPVGDLRFAPPQKPYHHDYINATEVPPSCPQFDQTPNYFSIHLPQYNTVENFSEDCLYLCVYKPTGPLPKKPLPVIVWIFGGGFTIGGIDVPDTDPKFLLEKKQDFIMVKINYRVNVFGFPDTPALSQQNPGLLDQRLAVEWVRDNIAAFGGDAEKITLLGHSAGAESIDYMPYAYPEDPIAKGIILTSGSAMTPSGSQDYSGSNFTSLAKKLNCTTTTPAAELACMRSVSWQDIETALKGFGATRDTRLNFQPIADNITYFSNYTERTLAKQFAPLPAIYGSNRNEAESLIDSTTTAAPPNQTLVEIDTLAGIMCPQRDMSKLRNHERVATWRFEWAGNFTNLSPLPWMGAYHQSNMPVYFDTLSLFGPSTALEIQIANTLQDLLLAFAADPSNAATNLPKMGWPLNHYGMGSDDVLAFGANGTATQIEQGAFYQWFCNHVEAVEEGESTSVNEGVA